MPDHNAQTSTTGLACAVAVITDWVRKQRESAATARGLADTGETAAIAHELGLSSRQLRDLAAMGPHAADELPRLLEALKIDADALALKEPMVLRDLERVCSLCAHKRECGHDLASGDASHNYQRYCPNADTLQALLAQDAS